MSDDRYVFGEDVGQERDRLAALERALDVPTQNVLAEVGVSAGWRCWEVGAGRGSIAGWLSRVVGSHGQVLATDLDDEWFDLAASKVTFGRHDVTHDPLPEDKFDLVHARFLLEHLTDPCVVMKRLADALRPGGVLVLEDSAGLAVNITPAAPIFDDFVPAWERAGRAVGWNATYGSVLMSDLRTIGLLELCGREYRQLGPGGDSWRHVTLGIQRLRSELMKQGITHEHLTDALRCLADPAKLIAGPPVTIAWGRRAG